MSTQSVPNTGGMVVVTHVYPQQGAQGDGLPQTGAAPAPSSRLQKFLKGEPSILGTVQIMTGIVILLFGIVGPFAIIYLCIIYITAGSLTIRADKTRSSCMVKASLGMNVVSFVAAAAAIIIYCLEIIILEYKDNSVRVMGIVGVMLVLSVLQFIVSICLFAFACRATCSRETQMAPPPSCVLTAAHGSIEEDSSSDQAGALPPKYTPTTPLE